MSIKEYYRITIFILYDDYIIHELKERFLLHITSIFKCILFLNLNITKMFINLITII